MLIFKTSLESFKSNCVESKIASLIFNLSILKLRLTSFAKTGIFTSFTLGVKIELKFPNKLDISLTLTKLLFPCPLIKKYFPENLKSPLY